MSGPSPEATQDRTHKGSPLCTRIEKNFSLIPPGIEPELEGREKTIVLSEQKKKKFLLNLY